MPDNPNEEPTVREIVIKIPEALALALEPIAKDKTLPEWFESVASTAIRKPKKDTSYPAPPKPLAPRIEESDTAVRIREMLRKVHSEFLAGMPEEERDEFAAEFSKRELQANAQQQIRDELLRQSDRGVAVMGSAYVEDYLRQLLEANWRSEGADEAKDRTLNPSGPLGSFSAKIDMAYLTKLIGPDTHKDLHTLRNIRNDFAHAMTLSKGSHEPLTFNTQSVTDRCNNFIAAPKCLFGPIPSGGYIIPDSSRNKYVLTVLHYSRAFEVCADSTIRWGPNAGLYNMLA